MPQSKACVHVLCGRTGSGKTTFAHKLERSGVIRLPLDDWMIALYGHHMPRELFDARLLACKTIMLELSETLLQRGVSVVLDFGLWKRADRKHLIDYLNAHTLPYKFYFLDASDDELWQRLEKRNQNLPEGTFEITRDMFEMFSSWFEPITEEEGIVIQTEPEL